jgi:hypothetical protein
LFGVGKVLEGEDGVEVGQMRIGVFAEWKGERNIFI